MRICAAALAVLVLAGCSPQAPEPLPPNVQSQCALAEGHGPKIGIAYGVGGRGDRGMNDSAFKGIAKALDAYSATCIEDEAVEGETEAAREDRLARLADQTSTVVAVGSGYSEAAAEVAAAHPKVHFGVIDGHATGHVTPSNVAYLGFAEEQGSFLMGAAAALKSGKDSVGFVGGVHDARTRRYEAGFRAGALAVRPTIKVLATYLKEKATDDLPDEPSPTQAAADLYDRGVRVIYQVSAGTGAGVFNAAKDADRWAIGSDYDQYQTASEDQRPHLLTSMIKRANTVAFDFIRDVEAGRVQSGDRTYGIKEHGVGFATSGGQIKDISADLDDFAQQIAAGDLKIPRR